MALALPKTCSMGSSQTGLVGTIGVTLLNPDGTVDTARATAGIYEIGGGCYGKSISFSNYWTGSIKWDTGGGTPVYAVEEYSVDGLVMEAIFERTVTIDSVTGQAGTTFPIGTHAHPVNNLTDALTICADRGLDCILAHTNLTIGAAHNVDGLCIETHGTMGTSIIFQAGCSADNLVIRYAGVSGVITAGDSILMEFCSIGNLSNFSGVMKICAFEEGSELSLNTVATIIECYCGGEPTNEPEINIGTAALSIACFCGNLKLTNKTGANRTVASFRAGNVSIASTCVAGKIQILGTGEVESDESGAGCIVDVDAALTNKYIADHVWEELTAEHTTVGSFSKLLDIIQAKAKFIAKEF